MHIENCIFIASKDVHLKNQDFSYNQWGFRFYR